MYSLECFDVGIIATLVAWLKTLVSVQFVPKYATKTMNWHSPNMVPSSATVEQKEMDIVK